MILTLFSGKEYLFEIDDTFFTGWNPSSRQFKPKREVCNLERYLDTGNYCEKLESSERWFQYKYSDGKYVKSFEGWMNQLNLDFNYIRNMNKGNGATY